MNGHRAGKIVDFTYPIEVSARIYFFNSSRRGLIMVGKSIVFNEIQILRAREEKTKIEE
jgi:hypothetical protein